MDISYEKLNKDFTELYDDFDYFRNEVILDIEIVRDSEDNEEIIIKTEIGYIIIRHDQDCCEHVELVDSPTDDELTAVIGAKLIDLECTSEEWSYEEGIKGFSFFKIVTSNLTLVLRFEGESNGYYGIEAFPYFYVNKYLVN